MFPCESRGRSDTPIYDGGPNFVFRLAIAADGSIDECVSIGGPLSPAQSARYLPTTTEDFCKSVMNRRLFSPATDPAGKPVRGVASYSF